MSDLIKEYERIRNRYYSSKTELNSRHNQELAIIPADHVIEILQTKLKHQNEKSELIQQYTDDIIHIHTESLRSRF